MMKKNLIRSICLFIVLLMTGCGNQDREPEISQGNSASQNIVAEDASVDAADKVSENQTGGTVSGNESRSMVEEMEVFELSNGLYAYVTTNVSRDIAIEEVAEWIRVQNNNPEDSTGSSDMRITIPNVYGTVTDVRMEDYSKIFIDYEDDEGESGHAVIPIDLYVSEGDGIEPLYRWERHRYLLFNREELTNETELPIEVWSETFISGGKEYTAVYSRISPMYGLYSDFMPSMADYQFAILQGDETLYEVKLYQMGFRYEDVHFMEDINGDGVEDFIQINNNGCYPENTVPYVFVWDQEQETCISGGPIAPDDRSDVTKYHTVLYDRDAGIFYDASDTERNAIYGHDLHGSTIVCGARFIDGEWKTVYEMYLGEDYALETKYDEEGNIISETTCTVEEHYDLINDIYRGCDSFLCEFGSDYTEEEVEVNEQFSYWKYVRNEE